MSRGNSLAIIPAGGGALSLLSATDTATDRLLMNPKVLSDGKTVIVTRWRGSTVSAGLWVATIGEGKATDLQLPGSYVLGMIDDHLVYDTQSGVLMAVPFDIGQAEGHWARRCRCWKALRSVPTARRRRRSPAAGHWSTRPAHCSGMR